jgi:uncharacterized protein with HEPN domain
MSKDCTAYLLHILDAINIIESYISGLTEDSFRQNRLIQDGVIRNLEIVGEATKKLPRRLRNKYPGIEWKETFAQLYKTGNFVIPVKTGIQYFQVFHRFRVKPGMTNRRVVQRSRKKMAGMRDCVLFFRFLPLVEMSK